MLRVKMNMINVRDHSKIIDEFINLLIVTDNIEEAKDYS